jgi:DNA repair exonuclease SbcCD ATPase subunit
MDLDEVADELYAVPPEDFVAVRTARQDEAKADGDKALAKQIGALPKPSAAAWAANLLVREQRAEIEALVELGGLLREAQETLAGDELKALNKQRAQLLSALTRQASALARQHGRPISSSVAAQVEETLRAGMTEPDAGEALLLGRLTSSMSYSGMGTLTGRPDLRLVRPPKAEPSAKPAPAPAPKTAKKPASDDRESAAARREREREEARRAAEEKHRRDLARAQEAADAAAAAAEEAQTVADEQRREAEELTARHDELQQRVEELADQLAEAEREVADAAVSLKRAQRRSTAAEREATEAAEAAERAAAHAENLARQGPG